MKIAILGEESQTSRYVQYIKSLSADPFVTLNPKECANCDGLLLPGGGDITPAFFGERKNGSVNINTRLDILQMDAFDIALRNSLPIIGICKGMQLINVALGGTLYQHLTTADIHRYADTDQYHPTVLCPGTLLFELYGPQAVVNSAHHQGIHILGQDLIPLQWCIYDNCIEAIAHKTQPILGVQWHPERLDSSKTTLSGLPLLKAFLQLCAERSPSPRSWCDPYSPQKTTL